MKKMVERAMVENWSSEEFVTWMVSELKAELKEKFLQFIFRLFFPQNLYYDAA